MFFLRNYKLDSLIRPNIISRFNRDEQQLQGLFIIMLLNLILF